MAIKLQLLGHPGVNQHIWPGNRTVVVSHDSLWTSLGLGLPLHDEGFGPHNLKRPSEL